MPRRRPASSPMTIARELGVLPSLAPATRERRGRHGGPESQLMSTHTSTTGPLGQPRGIGFAILLAIVTLGIYTLYWVFKTQDEVKEHSGIGVGGVLGLVIYILISPITWFLIPSDVGKMFKADGREAPFTGWTGLWLLLPIIGAFVWFIKIQGALNRYWESKSASVRLRLRQLRRAKVPRRISGPRDGARQSRARDDPLGARGSVGWARHVPERPRADRSRCRRPLRDDLEQQRPERRARAPR